MSESHLDAARDRVPAAFRRMAEGFSPLYARLALEHADSPVVARVAGDHEPPWEVPLRLFGAVHYLELTGAAERPWDDFARTLAEHERWIAGFVAEQPVQTNEVQRSWALLPAFLLASDGRPIDLIELGASAGLNLLWDRYAYRYGDLRWGPRGARLELAGEAVDGPPARLFARRPRVRRRVGIDRSPVDVRDPDACLLLQAFVWADQAARVERLQQALELARDDPPELVGGDMVELLPELLRDRDLDAQTVVFDSASLAYLSLEGRGRIAETIEADGRRGGLAWVSFAYDEDEASFALELETWPGEGRRRLARVDGHGGGLLWLA
jgi:hypothetical protein